ncbi:MAG: hypothetical protein AABZ47_17385 [Planctomycetota bacterium]
MRVRVAAVSLVDLLVVCALIALLSAFVIPTTARVRELSKRSVCGINLAGIGAANKIYAESNTGRWPVPAFKNATIDQQGIEYTNCGRTIPGSGDVTCDRRFESRSETPSCFNCGSTQVAVTRAYWMMVRSGAITVKQFICPSSGDIADPTVDLGLYYDFTRISNISYGYQVPFGPRDTRPREGMDHRQVIAADKGPWYLPSKPNWNVGPQYLPISLNDPPILWRRFNSPNHGGSNSGEGQNVLFADGSASFVRMPAVGVDNDNIYTKMAADPWVPPFNRIHGETPHEAPNSNTYPGQDVFGYGPGRQCTTDSLIYP